MHQRINSMQKPALVPFFAGRTAVTVPNCEEYS